MALCMSLRPYLKPDPVKNDKLTSLICETWDEVQKAEIKFVGPIRWVASILIGILKGTNIIISQIYTSTGFFQFEFCLP
jgi:hypothetical protein